MLEILSLGAGVQSTTLALMAAHGEIGPMPDCAIFADTGAEPPEVYEHLEWLRGANVLPFPVRTVSLGNLREDIERTAAGEAVREWADGYLPVPFYTVNADGTKGLLRRHCTQNYKIREIERGAKVALDRDPDKAIRSRTPLVRSWVGISTDERHRINWSGPKWIAKRFPFLGRALADDPQDLWMSRRDCEAWLTRHDYPIPAKSACTFCVFRRNAEWRQLRDHSPDAWAEAIAIDRMIRDMPAARRGGLRKGGQLFVHDSRVPLEEADIDLPDDDLWAGECEGMCGL